MSNIIECRSVSFSYNEGNNKTEVLELIIELNKNKTTALLIVTHDLSIANKMGRKLTLSNSEIHET